MARTTWCPWCLRGSFFHLAALALLAAIAPSPASAQVTLDGTLGTGSGPLAGPNYQIGAQLGRQMGGNLFHSFGQLNLAINESATFSGPANVANVIGRVTGGSASSIDGTLRSTIPGANLFLINPAGMMFGPNARLDVQGAFHASTADHLTFADGARFSASNPGASTLTVAPPSAFGFLAPSPADVTVQGATLAVTESRAVSLIGGNVSVSGGMVQALSGTIHVAAAGGPAEIPLDPTASAASALGGTVTLNNLAFLSADNLPSSGGVFIRGGRIVMDGAASVQARNFGAGPGSRIDLEATSDIALSGGAFIQAGAGSGATGPGGGVSITAGGAITVTDSIIGAPSFSGADAGPIDFAAPRVTLDGGLAVPETVAIDSQSGPFGSGRGGKVTITADEVTMRRGATIRSVANSAGRGGDVEIRTGSLSMTTGASVRTTTFSAGQGGDITIAARDAIVLDGGGLLGTGLIAGTFLLSTGDSGNVQVSAPSIGIFEGATIGANTFSIGRSGDVRVAASDALTIDARGSGLVTGISNISLSLADGAPGAITVDAGTLTLTTGGAISSQTVGLGNAGDIRVIVRDRLEIRGETFLTGINANALGLGNAGNVSVEAGTVTITEGGGISGTTLGSGRGGNVSVKASGRLDIDGQGADTGIFAEAREFATGAAGSVVVDAAAISIARVGQISSSTFGAGDGGNVRVTAGEQIAIVGGGPSTGIFAQANPGSTGRGGSIAVEAGAIALADGGRISSDTFGSGNAGSVSVEAGAISIASNGSISSATFGQGDGGGVRVVARERLDVTDGLFNDGNIAAGIFAQANPGSTGNAGDVSVEAGSIRLTNGGQVSSATFGPGAGGNVGVNAGTVTAATSGQISSATFGSGDGGSVVVEADTISIASNGAISGTTFSSGKGGSVRVLARDRLDVTDGLFDVEGFAAGIFAQANPFSTGDAGSVSIEAGSIALSNGGQISSGTFGPGRGGSVAVTARDRIDITDNGAVTGIFVQADRNATGKAGDMVVTTDTLSIAGIDASATISSADFGTGGGGNVRVVVREATISGTEGNIRAVATQTSNAGIISIQADRLTLRDGGAVTTQAASGAGGQIDIQAIDLVYLLNAQITTSVGSGVGGGGNITIDPRFVILNNGRILAQAVGGDGGDITIVAENFLASAGSLVDASSDLAVDGTITIEAPDVDVSGGLVTLASDFARRAELWRNACGGDRPASSLAPVGRGGLAQDVEGAQPALYLAERAAPAPSLAAPYVAGGAVQLAAVRLGARAIAGRCGR